MDLQFPNFALIEYFISFRIINVMGNSNKGFKTIFKMTWKYKDFIEKIIKLLYEVLLDMIFMEFIYVFS
jgi:hypothetical protein